MEGITRASCSLHGLSTSLPLRLSRPALTFTRGSHRLPLKSYSGTVVKLPQLRVQASQAPAATEGKEMVGSEKVAESLKSVEVLDLEGRSIPVTDLWKDRRVVVGFTRHFGCVLCMKRADLLASCKEEFDAANVSLIIIGPGKVEQAKTFAVDKKFPGEIYADPNAATHRALEFVSGVGSTFSLSSGLKVISAYLEGYRQDWGLSFDKDTRSKGGWQQGGVLVAGPGRENIVYLFKDAEAGDEPNMDDLVKAACGKA
ncbi:hypothetical protein GOP47_0012277 [Adiantum capillus-veneris]|uniref:Thioredoxin-like protein AAED1, chloroplastic n=1 Tax=Adiantum capillus-veneris TaxID=13818 RepID=A0A9D4UQM0_ADICA|nr:hypothetical protein GOP47_0012277 [Adiantum capillus-veneris]